MLYGLWFLSSVHTNVARIIHINFHAWWDNIMYDYTKHVTWCYRRIVYALYAKNKTTIAARILIHLYVLYWNYCLLKRYLCVVQCIMMCYYWYMMCYYWFPCKALILFTDDNVLIMKMQYIHPSHSVQFDLATLEFNFPYTLPLPSLINDRYNRAIYHF